MDARDTPTHTDVAYTMLTARQAVSAAFRPLPELASSCGYKSQELARVLGISPRHLQRLFAQKLGCSPRQWLNEQRLLAARQLLCRARTVKEVAYALGFSSVSQFSRDFRRHFGQRPSSLLREQTE